MKKFYGKCQRWCIYLLVCLGIFLFGSYAKGQTGGITVDGNPGDWPAVLTDEGKISTFVMDEKQPDGTDNQFTSGAKDYSDAPEMVWSWSQVSDKDELMNAGVYVCKEDGHYLMYFFADRYSTQGSSEIGFWVFQNGTAPTEGYVFAPEKTIGDFLILATFTQGGRIPDIEVYRWMGTTYSGTDRLQLQTGLTADEVYAYVSDDIYPVPHYPDEASNIWEYCHKQNMDCGTYYPGSFFEGMINLTALDLEMDLCGATFLMETRNSHSLNSALNDFAGGSIGTTPVIMAEGDGVCAPGGDVTLCALTEEGGSDIPEGWTIQWYYDEALTDSVLAADGGDQRCLTIEISQETDFWVTATDEFECCSEAAMATGLIYPLPSVSVGDQAMCDGDGAVTFETSDLGEGYSYQWYLNDVAISGATSHTYTTGTVTLSMDDNVYKVVVKEDATGCENEDSGVLTVWANPEVSVDDEAMCDGDGTVTFETPDLGEGYSYQWYLDDVAISGATSNSWTTGTVDMDMDGDIYKVVVTHDATGCDSEDSGELTVWPNPEVSVDDEAMCDGDGTVTFETSDLGEGYSYQWYLDDVAISGATSNSWTTGTVDMDMDGDIYKVVVTHDATGCDGEDSGELTVWPNPEVSVDDEAMCDGDGTVTFETSDLGTGYSYQWYLDDVAISGATGYSYTTGTVDLTMDGEIYKVVVTHDATGCDGEDSGELTVWPNPEVSVDDEEMCDGDGAVTFETSDLGTGYSYQWYLDDVAISGATGYSYTTGTVDLTMDGEIYKVVVTHDATGCDGEDSGELTVWPNPVVSVDDEAMCDGDGTVTFETSDLGEGYSYQWYLNNVAVSGATSNSWTTGTVDMDMDGDIYKVVVTHDATGCDGEDSGELTVWENPTCTINKIDAVCEDNGEATVIPSGGASPYTYEWTGPEGFYSTSEHITGLGAGMYYVTVTDVNGCTGECEVEILFTPCDQFCTLTQGFYGNPGGIYCDGTSTPDLLAELLSGGLYIGCAGHSYTLTSSDVQCVMGMLPGGGPSAVLAGDYTCGDLVSKQGRLVNGLLAQTITLGLNMELDPDLATLTIEPHAYLDAYGNWQYVFWTSKSSSCGEEGGEPVGEWKPFHLPGGVLTDGAVNVADLFEMANDALCGMDVGVSMGDLAMAIGAINDGFDECAFWSNEPPEIDGFAVEDDGGISSLSLKSAITLRVYPNPFKDQVIFEFTSPEDRYALLEITNMLGQKVATLMDRQVKEGVLNRVDYEPSGMGSGILIYRLVLDGNVTAGTIIYEKE